MNDPFECLGYINRSISKVQIKTFKDKLNFKISTNKRLYNFNDFQITKFINDQRKETISRHTFCSLSESFEDISMWSHYASSHTGFVLEIEFGDEEITDNFQKVRYVNELPEFDVKKLAEFLNGEDDKLDYLLSDISIKSENWKNEKEWRIWRESPCYFHYEKVNIKNVYFGINCEFETKATIAKLIADINKDVLFYQMKFGDNPIRIVAE